MNVIPLGGAGTVTGSRFLIRSNRTRILVDCGLFQGLKVLRLRNWRPFPVPPRELDAVVLTHAHLDHSGYLPVLVREGFRGPIYVTPPTADLLPILLEDAGRLQEEDAGWANRKGYSRHHPARPLFTEADAQRVRRSVRVRPFGQMWDVEEVRLAFHRAGHILGAASLEVRDPGGKSTLFSGDLGRREDPLLPAPVARVPTDLVLMESTYGDRRHAETDPATALRVALESALLKGGIAMFATFAVGRAQTLALLIHRLMERGEIPEVPVFLNSPMAIRVTDVHLKHAGELRPGRDEVRAAMDRLIPTPSVEDSRELNHRRGPVVILAGAGMMTGGRILHHLKVHGEDRRNALILPGFQAEGTRGRRLLRGERSLRIHGQDVQIDCQVHVLDVLSGHADADELTEWVAAGPEPRSGVLLVHGEPAQADALRRRLCDREPNWVVQVAEEGESYP